MTFSEVYALSGNRDGDYNDSDRRESYRRLSGMANAVGAVLAAIGIVLALAAIFSLVGWFLSDENSALLQLIRTVTEVVTNPVGELKLIW